MLTIKTAFNACTATGPSYHRFAGCRPYAVLISTPSGSREGYVNSWINLHLAQTVASETTRRFSTAEATLMLANKR